MVSEDDVWIVYTEHEHYDDEDVSWEDSKPVSSGLSVLQRGTPLVTLQCSGDLDGDLPTSFMIRFVGHRDDAFAMYRQLGCPSWSEWLAGWKDGK